jgi:large subunit ribosomal protein L15
MKYNELNVAKAKAPKRVGRGIAAGQGKTAGRGTKGQNSRTGSSRKPGFEGGQNPLMQRLPKLRGFRSSKVAPEVVYTGQLDALTGKTVDNAALAEAKLVSNAFVSVKLVVKGEITKPKTVALQAASATAIAAIEKAGGSFVTADRQQRPVTNEANAQSRKAKREAKTSK